MITKTGIKWTQYWNKQYIHPKQSLFGWKLMHHVIPLKTRISSYMLLPQVLCEFCLSDIETMDHIFLHCPFVAICFYRCLAYFQQLINHFRALSLPYTNIIIICLYKLSGCFTLFG